MTTAQTDQDKGWRCPKCGASANEHGTKPTPECSGAGTCSGLLCECDDPTDDVLHGTFAEPCPHANCYHCGWGGQIPSRKEVAIFKAEQRIDPTKLTGWAKQAWAEGWRPPASWKQPKRKK